MIFAARIDGDGGGSLPVLNGPFSRKFRVPVD